MNISHPRYDPRNGLLLRPEASTAPRRLPSLAALLIRISRYSSTQIVRSKPESGPSSRAVGERVMCC
jgi:hypothetical protein